MSKKQIRLVHPEQIQNRIGEFLNKKINIVLNDNTVLLGELKHVEKEELIFQNMRMKMVKLPINKINEVYLDIDA